MTGQTNLVARQHPAADAQRQLQQIADLVDEYAELAEPTGNADLVILLYQIRIVLGDDPAQAGQRISRRPTAATSLLTPTLRSCSATGAGPLPLPGVCGSADGLAEPERRLAGRLVESFGPPAPQS